MACMTHSCPCGHKWFDNKDSGDCPKCGNDKNIGHHFDELPDEPEETDLLFHIRNWEGQMFDG